MNIRNLLNEQKIIKDLVSKDKNGILKELASLLARQEQGIDLNLLTERLIERENSGSTGIGDNIAVPHCKYEGINGILMILGISAKGLEFDSIDNKPVNIFFLLVAPNHAAGEHLRALAKITRILKNEDFKNKLLSAKSEGEIYKLVSEEDEKY